MYCDYARYGHVSCGKAMDRAKGGNEVAGTLWYGFVGSADSGLGGREDRAGGGRAEGTETVTENQLSA